MLLSTNSVLSSPDMLDRSIAITVLLFILSLISERIITWFKLYYGRLGRWFIFFTTKEEDLRSIPRNSAEEKRREVKTLGLNITMSIVIAISSKANLFDILSNMEPYSVLGWTCATIKLITKNPFSFLKVIFGCILTGFFISLGSKFWHDMLDMLYQIKNYKERLANGKQYVEEDEDISIMAELAYFEAHTHYTSMDKVVAFGIKRDEIGSYYEVTVRDGGEGIPETYPYIRNNKVRDIRVEVVKQMEDDVITASSLNLSSKLFNAIRPESFGTLGCIVRLIDGDVNTRYLLTCCHNVLLHSELQQFSQAPKDVDTSDGEKTTFLGRVHSAILDNTTDAALIDVRKLDERIKNKISVLGRPRDTRVLKDSDVNTLTVRMFGAASKKETSGIVTTYTKTIDVKYPDLPAHRLNGVIEVSRNGKRIDTPGDSGSIVMDESGAVVGILVAGEKKASYLLPINTILKKMNAALITV